MKPIDNVINYLPALAFGDLNDPKSYVSLLLKARDTVRIRPWLGTEPTLRYIPVVKTGV